MIDNLANKTSFILTQAIRKGLFVEEIYDLLEKNSDEVSGISAWALGEDGRKLIAARFKEVHKDAVPVYDHRDIEELSHFGKKGLKVGWTMHSLLEEELGKTADIIKELKRSSTTEYKLSELGDFEAENLKRCVQLVSRALRKMGEQPVNIETDLSVCDFTKDDLLGTFDPNYNHIRLARKILGNFGCTLYTLIHEAAHRHGGDGVKTHEAAIGELCELVFNDMNEI
jgi:hypothetical protein